VEIGMGFSGIGERKKGFAITFYFLSLAEIRTHSSLKEQAERRAGK
jgi:hypothetical protein